MDLKLGGIVNRIGFDREELLTDKVERRMIYYHNTLTERAAEP